MSTIEGQGPVDLAATMPHPQRLRAHPEQARDVTDRGHEVGMIRLGLIEHPQRPLTHLGRILLIHRVPSLLEERNESQADSVIGSGLSYADLDKEIDTAGHGEGWANPVTERAWRVMGHRWVEIENVDTDSTVILRLQFDREDRVNISSVVLPFNEAQFPTGADLRAIPVAALNAAFTRHEQQGKADMRIALALGEDLNEDPLTPLPPASARDSFTARVARQYVTLEKLDPSSNVATAMSMHNNAAKSSVQRWIARARKQGFLPPAEPRRRASS